MKVRTLRLCVILTALVTLLFLQPASSQSIPPTPCHFPETGTQFTADKVRALNTTISFDFATNGGLYKGHYQQPLPDGPTNTLDNVDASINTEIAAAFDGAPPFFQSELCKLSYVFIDPARQGPVGWSFHEGDGQTDPNHNDDGPWIGIWQGFWTEPRAKKPILQVLATRELLSLLEINDFQNRHFKPHYQPMNSPGVAAPNTWEMSLLTM
jgi:hypothetical protein